MNVIVYYEHGQVVKMLPEPNVSYYEVRERINEAEVIVSDGVKYDLTDKNSICSISVPSYTYTHTNRHAIDLGVTGFLDYVLRMHASLLWVNDKYDLAILCLEKATQLMAYSTIGWQQKDFFRIVDWLTELGRFKRAAEWRAWIEKNTKTMQDLEQESFSRTLESCQFLQTDLVEVGSVGTCCSICAKYRNRIYSLSGKDKRFPKFPKDFHMSCGLHVSPFIYGVMEPRFKCKNYILHSWRPFIDCRSKKEKQAHIKWLEDIEKTKYRERPADLNHIVYYWFKPKFPNDFPKSLSAFSRMRNANTEKYQALVQKIEKAGYKIPTSLEEVAAREVEMSEDGYMRLD
ncbi:MAG: phage minor capsid protein [Oscillospiraceae bacterium]|nr:phage minor capsid protein [Oscillospiraceae bacterium]